MGGFVLLPFQFHLERLGFSVRRFTYSSWHQGLEQNVLRLARFVAATPAKRIHLVGHSLGGLLALTLLSHFQERRIGRTVLMGSPYSACHCGQYLAARPILAPLLGHSLRDWLVLPKPSLPDSVELGIIAGTCGMGLGRSIPGLPRPNDGMVSLEETHLPGAKDSIALPLSHTGLLLSAACASQAAAFLKTGSFRHV